eukprot:12093391-Alexandrium_andersonii.AAC.1
MCSRRRSWRGSPTWLSERVSWLQHIWSGAACPEPARTSSSLQRAAAMTQGMLRLTPLASFAIKEASFAAGDAPTLPPWGGGDN